MPVQTSGQITATGRPAPAGLSQAEAPAGSRGLPGGGRSAGACDQAQEFYFSPEVRCFVPGDQLYIDSIIKLQDQFIFASAYPMAG